MAYIDRDLLIEKIESTKVDGIIPNWSKPEIKDTICKQGQAIKKIIETQPTADVQEVKHSQWVVEAYDNQDNIVVIPYIEHQHCEPFCLICGKRALLNGAEDYVTSNYCPNCGAKMNLKEGN